MKKIKKITGFIIRIIVYLLLAVLVFSIVCNMIVVFGTKSCIYSDIDSIPDDDYDAIVVLGCEVLSDGNLSVMLQDRMDAAISVYMSGKCSTLLLSGDKSQYYDEVTHMKEYAESKGVNAEDIICDYRGYSTYDTFYNVCNEFELSRIIIITQNYHLYRSVFLADSFNIDAVGYKADRNVFERQLYFSAREYLARIKDLGFSILKPEPTENGYVFY